jgi:hypothetical protein
MHRAVDRSAVDRSGEEVRSAVEEFISAARSVISYDKL